MNWKQRITQFQQAEVVQADPEIAISTGWNTIDRTNWDTEEVGGGSVDPGTGGLYELSVTAADGDVAALETTDRVEYVPSMAALWGFAFLADSVITEDQEFRAGVTNRPTWMDSYQYRIEGTPAGQDNDHYLVIRKGGQDSIVRQWDGWPSDPRLWGWDETVGAIFRGELGWYDFGVWEPQMQIPDLRDGEGGYIDLQQNPTPDVPKTLISLDELAPAGQTATNNVNFRIRFELQNVGANAAANTVKAGNCHWNILGQNEPNPRSKDVERNGGGIGGSNITNSQPYPLVAIRGTEDDVKMLLQQITIVPGTDNVEVTAYLMDKSDVSFTNGPDADFGPPPGLDTREAFFEDVQWDLISSVTRFDAAGTGNNNPHVGTEGWPVGRKIAGSTVIGGSGSNKSGEQGGLDANAQLTDKDYIVIFARGTTTAGISLQALDYEMAVDR